MHEYLVMGLVAIAAIILANMFFPKLPLVSGLAKYL